jgi:hypothetical protein
MTTTLQDALTRRADAHLAHEDAKRDYLSGAIDGDTYLAARRPYEAACVDYAEALRRAQGGIE